MADDLYELLEVSPRASGEVIQAAYRRLARTYHPDGSSPDHDKMVSLNLAFEVLSDVDRRAAYDRDRGSAVASVDAVADSPDDRPAWLANLPPIEYFDDPAAPPRPGVVLWALGGLAVVVVASAFVVGSGLIERQDDAAPAADATVGARTATPEPSTLQAPTGAASTATPTPTPARPQVTDLGPIASGLPGTPLPVGTSVRSVVDQTTKPRDVYAVTLVAGQEIRFTLNELTSPISAWVETSVVNPGARDLADPRSFSLALTRTTFARDEWRFTPAIAGTYYLVVRAQTSGQAYAFTLSATR